MKKAHLLIADDDRVIVATLSEDLIAHGFQVQTAANGAEAVALCKSNPPDLAILDIRMPVMDGIEAAHVINQECGVAVLFLSAYSDKELVEKAVAEGALGYLVKPITTEKLLPAVTAALARAREMRASLDMQQHLTQAMKAKREIDVAVGILLERYSLSREQAFEVLRRLSRSNNRKLEELAVDVIKCCELLGAAQLFVNEVVHGASKTA